MKTEQYYSVAITKNTTALRRWLDALASAFFTASLWLIVSPIINTTIMFGAATFASLTLVSIYRWCTSRQGRGQNLSERVSGFVTRYPAALIITAATFILILPIQRELTLIAVVGALIGVWVLHLNPWHTSVGEKVKPEAVADLKQKIEKENNCILDIETCARFLNDVYRNDAYRESCDGTTMNTHGVMKDTGEKAIVGIKAHRIGRPTFTVNHWADVERDGSFLIKISTNVTPWGAPIDRI